MPFIRRPALLAALLVTACAIADSRTAQYAQKRLVGMSEVDLESCLGSPDQHASFGDVDVLTYDTTSSSSMGYSIPVIGGLSFSNGGNCHATFDLKDKHVTRVLYSGETNAIAAPDAYCAPIIRTCLGQLGPAPADYSRRNAEANSSSQPSMSSQPPAGASSPRLTPSSPSE